MPSILTPVLTALLVTPVTGQYMRMMASARGQVQALFGLGKEEELFGGAGIPGLLSLEDGRQLYANFDGWVQAAPSGELDKDTSPGWLHNRMTPGKACNTNPARRIWSNSDGVLTLLDGRQLYVNGDGWAAVAREGEHDNTEAKRRTWKTKRGVLSLADGRQLYVNRAGRAGTAQEGGYTNTDPARRVLSATIVASGGAAEDVAMVGFFESGAGAEHPSVVNLRDTERGRDLEYFQQALVAPNPVSHIFHLRTKGYVDVVAAVTALLAVMPDAAKTVDDRDGNTPLLKTFRHSSWFRIEQVVAPLLEAYPEAASVANSGRSLPLHVASEVYPCKDDCGTYVAAVKAILDAYPQGARIADATGNLPLHRAAGAPGGALDICELLHDAYPDALTTKNGAGKWPVELASPRRRSLMEVRWGAAPPPPPPLAGAGEVAEEPEEDDDEEMGFDLFD